MKLILTNVMTVIAEMLCYMNHIEYITKPILDYNKGTITFQLSAERGNYTYYLSMTDVIKLHDYKLTQYAYSLVCEYYEETSSH